MQERFVLLYFVLHTLLTPCTLIYYSKTVRLVSNQFSKQDELPPAVATEMSPVSFTSDSRRPKEVLEQSWIGLITIAATHTYLRSMMSEICKSNCERNVEVLVNTVSSSSVHARNDVVNALTEASCHYDWVHRCARDSVADRMRKEICGEKNYTVRRVASATSEPTKLYFIEYSVLEFP
jgi:hypothetical protein